MFAETFDESQSMIAASQVPRGIQRGSETSVKTRHRSIARLLGALLVGSALVVGPAFAQAYPNKPVRIIVPFAAGGGVDQVARILAAGMQGPLGAPIIVDNKPGGHTVIAAEAAARAEPDGHTLLIATTSTMSVNPHLYRTLPYDPAKDFVPIAQVTRVPFFLVVPASSGTDRVSTFIARAKATPGSVIFGSAGNGTTGHLGFELLSRTAGFEAVHVPYKSYGSAIPDLMTGRITAMIGDIPAIGGGLKSGKLHALATTGKDRSDFLPEVPTLSESGIEGFDLSVWFGLFAPTGTPAAIITQWSSELKKFLASPDGQKRLLAIGQIPTWSSAGALGKLRVAESDRWGTIIREADIKPD